MQICYICWQSIYVYLYIKMLLLYTKYLQQVDKSIYSLSLYSKQDTSSSINLNFAFPNNIVFVPTLLQYYYYSHRVMSASGYKTLERNSKKNPKRQSIHTHIKIPKEKRIIELDLLALIHIIKMFFLVFLLHFYATLFFILLFQFYYFFYGDILLMNKLNYHQINT